MGGGFRAPVVPKLSGSQGAALAGLPLGLPVLRDFVAPPGLGGLAEGCTVVAFEALPGLDGAALREAG